MISSLLSETHVAGNATHKCGFRPLKQCVSTRFSLSDADAIEYTKIHLSEREGIYSILFSSKKRLDLNYKLDFICVQICFSKWDSLGGGRVR